MSNYQAFNSHINNLLAEMIRDSDNGVHETFLVADIVGIDEDTADDLFTADVISDLYASVRVDVSYGWSPENQVYVLAGTVNHEGALVKFIDDALTQDLDFVR